MEIIEQKVDFIDGMDYVYGYDSLQLENHGPALKYDGNIHQLQGAGGQNTTCKIRLINRKADLNEFLEIDSKASLRYATFGGGSAKFNFYKNTSISSYSLDLMIYVKVTNGQKTVDLQTVKMQDKAGELYDSNMNQFQNTYGNTFVYGLITGGELFIHLSLQSDNSAELKSFSASIEASGGLGAWSGSASVSAVRQIRESIQNFKMLCNIERQGSVDPLPDVNDQKAIIDYALNFPKSVGDQSAVPFKALLMPYEYVFPSKVGLIDRENQIESLEYLSQLRGKLVGLLDDYEYIIGHPKEFNSIHPNEAKDIYDKISEAEEKVRQIARSCFNDTNNCKRPDADIIELTKYVSPQKEEKKMELPVGSIIAFSGRLEDAENQVQNGWYICDGRVINDPESSINGNTTPNLVNRFILGHTEIGGYGGDSGVTIPSQNIISEVSSWNDNNKKDWPPSMVVRPEGWVNGSPIVSTSTYSGSTISFTPRYYTALYLQKVK